MKNKIHSIPRSGSFKHIACSFCILLIACFCFLRQVFAVSPPPDGGYANGNTAEGEGALFSLTTGSDNTAAGFNALYSDTTGGANTAIGSKALSSNTTGYDNTAVGYAALTFNTEGAGNTAVGLIALSDNTTGGSNTAFGAGALTRNSTGMSNTAMGASAIGGSSFTTGSFNTASGVFALNLLATGNSNTANGYYALRQNTSGSNNVAIGYQSLEENTNGQANTGVGVYTLFNTTGRNNIALGYNAGRNLTTGNSNIDIGNSGGPGESNTMRLGKPGDQTNTYIAGISGVTIPGGVGVVIDTNGHLGTTTSSARYKEAIKPMDKSSEVLLSLQPVTFRYKKELDPKAMPQFGLVAEDVAKVDPNLVALDDAGKPYTVRYEAVNAMLLNEFLKEHKKVETQTSEIADVKATVAELKANLKAQRVQIQKVSDRLEATLRGPTVLAGN